MRIILLTLILLLVCKEHNAQKRLPLVKSIDQLAANIDSAKTSIFLSDSGTLKGSVHRSGWKYVQHYYTHASGDMLLKVVRTQKLAAHAKDTSLQRIITFYFSHDALIKVVVKQFEKETLNISSVSYFDKGALFFAEEIKSRKNSPYRFAESDQVYMSDAAGLLKSYHEATVHAQSAAAK